MQIAAIIFTFVAVYAGLLSFCVVAADAEDRANRYKRRTSQARATVPAVWRVSSQSRVLSMEVARGR